MDAPEPLTFTPSLRDEIVEVAVGKVLKPTPAYFFLEQGMAKVDFITTSGCTVTDMLIHHSTGYPFSVREFTRFEPINPNSTGYVPKLWIVY